MSGSRPREHYIPLRRADLVEMLAGDLDATPHRAELFRRFCDILSATLHFEYRRLHNDLNNAYAPFDPEATTVPAHLARSDSDAGVSIPDRDSLRNELFQHVDELMRRANFIPLTDADVERAATMRSEWGINMDVDLEAFDKVQMYYRGNTIGQRARRSPIFFWREEVVDVPVYQRLALVIKMRKHKRFPKTIDTEAVFLKYFKDIPQADIEMLLPGARIVMPGVHRLKLGGSLVSGLVILGYNVAKQIVSTAMFGMTYLWGLVIALGGYGWRQYAGYRMTKHACNLRLTQSLYFQTIANNSGVLSCLFDEAEEQDAREAILAYYFLWRFAGAAGMSARDLDDAIERDLEIRTGQPVDFEVDDALAKLERFHLVATRNGRYLAVPIQNALEILDRTWDNQFGYPSSKAA